MSQLEAGQYPATFVSIEVDDKATFVVTSEVQTDTGPLQVKSYAYTSDAAWPMTESKLRLLGFNGDEKNPDCSNKQYTLTLRHDMYQGKQQAKWELPYGRAPADASVIANLCNRFKQSNPGVAKTFAPKPTVKPVAPPNPVDDDMPPPATAKPTATKQTAWASWKAKKGGDVATWNDAIKEIQFNNNVSEDKFTAAHWAKIIELAELPF